MFVRRACFDRTPWAWVIHACLVVVAVCASAPSVHAQPMTPEYVELLRIGPLQTTQAWKADRLVVGTGANLAPIGPTASLTVPGYAFDERDQFGNRGGEARKLNGVDQAFSVPAADINARVAGGDWSLIMWLRRDQGFVPTAREAMGVLGSPSGGGSGGNIWFSPVGNAFGNLDPNLAVVIFSGNVGTPTASSAHATMPHSGALINGQWHMFGFTYTASTRSLQLVIDGQKSISAIVPLNAVPENLVGDFFIGNVNGPAGSPPAAMPWTFDYISLHAKALSTFELRQMYNVYLGFSRVDADVGPGGGEVVDVPIFKGEVLRDMSVAARDRKVLVLGVGDSQMVRNVGSNTTINPFTDTDQGFVLTESMMLRTLDRGRPLAGILGAATGPDASNSFVLGYACWNTSGNIGLPVSALNVIAERSLWHLNAQPNHLGFRLGVYLIGDGQPIAGDVTQWLYECAEDRWPLSLPYVPRTRTHFYRVQGASGPTSFIPALYRSSDGSILAGGQAIATTPLAPPVTGPHTLELAGTSTESTRLGLSLARTPLGATSVTGPLAIGPSLLENAAQLGGGNGFVQGVLWAYGGTGMWDVNAALARGGSNRLTILRNGLNDALDLVHGDAPAPRHLVIWIHQGGNDINQQYSTLTAFDQNFLPSGVSSSSPAGFKQNVKTFIGAVRAAVSTGPTPVAPENIHFVLGPYMDINNHQYHLLQRASRELAEEDANIAHIYGPHLVPVSQLIVGDTLSDSTHLNENGFVAYANAGSQAMLDAGLVAPLSNDPVARAGPDALATSGRLVTLDAGASFDPDGSIILYQWSQTAGPAVQLTDPSPPNSPVRTFTAPSVASATDLEFQVTVTDNLGNVATDAVVVRVSSCTLPVIAFQPTSAVLCRTQSASIAVVGFGDGPVGYQWSIENPTGSGSFQAIQDGPLTLTQTSPPAMVNIQGATTANIEISIAAAYTVPFNIRLSVAAIDSCGQDLASPIALAYCPADFACTGVVEVNDIFQFLNAWFNGHPLSDFDGNSQIQVADIFAFLNAWFAGC